MLKISLIGAGSGCFSIGLVRELCASKALSGSLVSLMDINKERLDAVYSLCLRYTKEIGGRLSFEKTTDRKASLQGADFIINTALTAPHSRLKDGWQIAERYGFRFGGSYHIMYDEAFWVNFYQLRFFEELTRDILSICPDAWHLMVANPVITGTTYIQRKYPEAKMVGLCHGYAHANRIAGILGSDGGDFTFQMSGPNHFVWLSKGHIGRRDFFEILDERLAANKAASCGKTADGGTVGAGEPGAGEPGAEKSDVGEPGAGEPVAGESGAAVEISAGADKTVDADAVKRPFGKIHEDFYRRHGVIGIGDTLGWTGACWPWFYHADEETEREFDDYVPMDGWNGYFNGVGKSAADIIALADDPERSVKDFMGKVGADDLMIPLVESLACNIPRILFVNMLNKGGLAPGIPEDFSVETQALCQRDEIRPIRADPLPRAMIAYILRDRVAPVEMELEALRTGKMNYLEELVLMDKWAKSIKQARRFIKEILELPYHGEMKEHYK